MPAATFTTDPTTFATWAAALSAQIQATGLTKTADTGQLVFPTALVPSAAHQSMGYEVYAFSDALQATSPVFMKIEYGSGGQGGNRPGLWITFGTGTDGAGNLTGRVSNRIPLSCWEASNSAGYNKSYISGANNRLCFSLWNNTDTRYGLLFSVERTCDAAGNLTGDGLLIVAKAHFSPGYLSGEQAWDHVWWNYTFILPPGHATVAGKYNLSGMNYCFANGWAVAGSGSSAYGADFMLMPVSMPSMRGLENPGKNLFGYWYSQIPLDTQFSLSPYGVARNYIALSYGSWWDSNWSMPTAMIEGFHDGSDPSSDNWRNTAFKGAGNGSNPSCIAMRFD